MNRTVSALWGKAGMPDKDVKPFSCAHRAMGTVFEIVIYSDRDEFFLRSLTENLFADLDRWEQEMSLFVAGSDIDRINESAGRQPVRVSREVFELIRTAVGYSELTGGYFDITVGPLMNLWGFYRKRDSAPSEDEIEAVLGKIGYENIVLDDRDGGVFLSKEGMSIDLGGIAKGCSLRALIEGLKKFELENFLINAGRSSVYAAGSPPAAEYWEAEFPVMEGGGSIEEDIRLKDNAVSISGSFEHYRSYGGKRYSHILNPLTGRPESDTVLTAVIDSDPLDCEILSTAFSAMGTEKTRTFLESDSRKGCYDVIVLFYDSDGNLKKAAFN
ncbi:FAD:protein FMN transferase [candidate division KSB1 bacterium]